MRDPLGPEEPGEKQIIDTLLSILAKEEQANRLPPPPEFLGVAEVHRKQRTEAYRSSPRTPRTGDFYQPRERRATNGNTQSPNTTSPVPPRQSPSSTYIRNPYHVGNKQRDLSNLKFKTRIPEMGFNNEMPTSSNVQMGAYDFRTYPGKNFGTQYNSPHQNKRPPMLKKEQRTQEESSTHNSTGTQRFKRQAYTKKNERASEPGDVKGRYPKSQTLEDPISNLSLQHQANRYP